jgi:hypothetical protein
MLSVEKLIKAHFTVIQLVNDLLFFTPACQASSSPEYLQLQTMLCRVVAEKRAALYNQLDSVDTLSFQISRYTYYFDFGLCYQTPTFLSALKRVTEKTCE